MAEEEVVEAAGPQARRGGVLPLVAVLLVTLGGGALAGQGLLGPGLGKALAERAAAAEEAGEHAEEGQTTLHLVDNLVVNPAGSGGSRFLITSLAIEAVTPEAAAQLAARDVEIRHAFTLVLGSRTVESLVDVAGRTALTEELLAAAAGVVGDGMVRRVLIPQFVIQ